MAAAVARRVQPGRAAAGQTHTTGPGGVSKDLPVRAAAVHLTGVTHVWSNWLMSDLSALKGEEESARTGKCVRVKDRERGERE